MKVYIYNNDFTEQSIRQMYTTVSYLTCDKLYLDNNWKSQFANLPFVDFINFDDFVKMKGDKAIVFFNIIDGYYLRKYKSDKSIFFVFRPRGILPEESYYRNKNLLKMVVLNHIERKVVGLTDYFIFLNTIQKDHYVSKYKKIKYRFDKSYILPNIKMIDKSRIIPNNNDLKLKLLYSGGFSKWQNIDLVYRIASDIILNFPVDTVFTVLTFKENFAKAEQLAHYYKIKNNTVIKYVPPSILDEEIVKHDVGIIIRDNSIINMAASPFKIVDYLSNGLALIVTDNISHQLNEMVKEKYYFTLTYKNGKLVYSNSELGIFISQIIENKNKNKEQIINDYYNFITNIKKIKLEEVIY
ncbi:glycosyltransferase family protein [Caldicoprobacter faecalis]|uniref:Uncharacterized protein n=1 Tax=Caldicoprobacter faecalis TaxID=937334 RepID=A0A1I5Y6T2_9FIRM|nr:hypothetical protein [Caldicoprobacter faecalis]SFQ39874.1 hypothetical protein SAMN05444406_1389 [Caldicoprobacter faecalis]